MGRRQPLAKRSHLITVIYGRHGVRHPRGFQRAGWIGQRAHFSHAVLGADLFKRFHDEFVIAPGPKHFEADLAGHAVPQGSNWLPADFEIPDVEESDLRERSVGHLSHHVESAGTLYLVDINAWITGSKGHGLVPIHLHVKIPGASVELHPIRDHGRAYYPKIVLLQVKHDTVAEKVSVMTRRNQLFPPIGRKGLQLCEGDSAQDFKRVLTAKVEIRHMVGKIQERHPFFPRTLLIAPIGVFRSVYRKHVRSQP